MIDRIKCSATVNDDINTHNLLYSILKLLSPIYNHENIGCIFIAFGIEEILHSSNINYETAKKLIERVTNEVLETYSVKNKEPNE